YNGGSLGGQKQPSMARLQKAASSTRAIEGTIVTQNSSEYQRWEQRFAVPHYAFGTEPNYFLASCNIRLCYLALARRSRLRMARGAMASGWPSRASTWCRLISRRRLSARGALWQRSAG